MKPKLITKEEKEAQDDFVKLFRSTASDVAAERAEAETMTSEAMETVIRDSIWDGSIVDMIFDRDVETDADGQVKYLLSPIPPGDENLYVAWTMPNTGYIAERQVKADYVYVPTYRVVNSADMDLRFAKKASAKQLEKYQSSLGQGFVHKANRDGWATILNAGVDRNVLVYDADATAGLFTKRLVSLMQTYMRRHAGGNTMSMQQRRMTHLFVSIEAKEDIRNWGLDQVDEVTRREIYVASEDSGALSRIMGVNIVDLTELGENAYLQNYYTNILAATLESSDVELVVGLDLADKGSADHTFVMPIEQDIQVYEDTSGHRRGVVGKYADMWMGVASLDNRRIVLGSF